MRMQKIRQCLAGIAIGLAAGGVWAADVVVSVDEGNPPFMYAKDGKPEGVYPAVLREAFARMGVALKLQARPWKRAIAEIDEGSAGVGGIYKNDERVKKYDYSAPILAEKMAVYMGSKKKFEFKTAADLRGMSVGVIRGWSYGDDFDALRKAGQVNVEETGSDAQNLQKLAAGRLDAVLVIAEAAAAIVKAQKLQGIEAAPTLLASNMAHLAFNKSASQAALLEKFNKVLAEMQKSGALETILVQELAK
ncbi:transporter substrate-binding domain-containing protein [Curvibacter sp. APW13]|uniref:substrate-binding periplasmic protein n=1 Tax=Curvibacter sp. APW13 TaxID=3077236 RepID=UPI0028DF3718|nr:transporter substrate-binding domain-containing protein [Curvibacter sp. APW13]MDT8992058.1 transporter substrate-binding domain-containing protein [Curvibacter sp. APW13]